MPLNAAPIANFITKVTALLNRIDYDSELEMLRPVEDSAAWTVVLDLAVRGSGTTHRRYRFSFRATPCDPAGGTADIVDLNCIVVGPLHGEKHVVFELVSAARAAMRESLDEPEQGDVAACGYGDLARALTRAMCAAGEETTLARVVH